MSPFDTVAESQSFPGLEKIVLLEPKSGGGSRAIVQEAIDLMKRHCFAMFSHSASRTHAPRATISPYSPLGTHAWQEEYYARAKRSGKFTSKQLETMQLEDRSDVGLVAGGDLVIYAVSHKFFVQASGSGVNKTTTTKVKRYRDSPSDHRATNYILPKIKGSLLSPAIATMLDRRDNGAATERQAARPAAVLAASQTSTNRHWSFPGLAPQVTFEDKRRHSTSKISIATAYHKTWAILRLTSDYSRIKRHLRNITRNRTRNRTRIGAKASIYLTAALEYLTAEVLELEGDVAIDPNNVMARLFNISYVRAGAHT
ncbi:hypothetical protein H2201_005136 [Coniosporium apollinis]|uniref:Histone H2A n=1 Tax=Coniosporium apollinis TaxID=61459 RepID=A0ABQ9NSY4_9PEZI|nr:hypothetical protein H2201_005136 [Coniosporium apollinis]